MDNTGLANKFVFILTAINYTYTTQCLTALANNTFHIAFTNMLIIEQSKF